MTTRTTETTTSKTIDTPSIVSAVHPTDPSPWVVLGLGSNLDHPEARLTWALEKLAETLGVLEIAPLYRTRPLSSIDQPDFFNTIAIARRPAGDRPSPRQILGLAKRLERQSGRRAGPRNGPRTLDIDLLLYGERQFDEPARPMGEGPEDGGGPLVVPHPRLRERRFVLAPLDDLAPDLRLPPDGARVADLLAALGDAQAVERLDWPT